MEITAKGFVNKPRNHIMYFTVLHNAILQKYKKGGVNRYAQQSKRSRNGLSKEMGDFMAEVKIGMTIEEASEYTGIGRNTMRKLVE